MKGFNDFLGNCYLVTGSLKSILVIILIIQLITVLTGGSATVSSTTTSGIIGLLELFLLVTSIVMLIVNSVKSYGKANTGHLVGIFAIGLELIFSGILLIFFSFFQCFCLLKAGMLIKNAGLNKEEVKDLKSTEWFFEDDKKE